MKTCTKCGETKPLDHFYTDTRATEGLSSWCKNCTLVCNREWRIQNAEKVNARNRDWYRKNLDSHKAINRKSQLKTKYNITPDEYNQLLEQQNHSCACCWKHQSELKKRLAVDHSHVSNKVRGLLCFKCNSAYGKLGDTEDGVLKLLAYARRTRDI